MKSISKAALLFSSLFFILLTHSACSVVAETPPIESYEDCVAAGNKVLRTFPARCVAADGRTFVEKTANIGELPLLGESESNAICVDKCGDGTCQMIVCMGSTCPCAESPDKCPKDCE